VVGGHAFYVFNTAKLNLVYMSRYIAEEISGIQVSEDGLVYTTMVETNTIQCWNKMHRVRTFTPKTKSSILETIVTKSFIFCLSENGHMTIFNTQSGDVSKDLKFKHSYTGMMHPLTYLNKLVFWSDK